MPAEWASSSSARGVGDAERLSTGAYFGRFVAELEAGGEHSPATITSYRKMTTLAARVMGHVALAKLTTAAIEDGYRTLLTGAKPLTRGTVRFLHRILVLALNHAVRRGMIPANPAINAAPARNRKLDEEGLKPKAFSPDEVPLLLAAAERDRQPDTVALVSLLLAAGLRRAEVLGIRIEDVDFDNGRLNVRGP
jgi:integrase